MTSFDDLLKVSNNVRVKDESEPMCSAIWQAMVEDYYAGLFERTLEQDSRLQPPGITMRDLQLPT